MSDFISPTGFTAPDPSQLADLFPGYQIVRLVACGGMGAVYEAVQIALDRAVAIKILPQEFTNDDSFRTGFQAEAKAMARLNHPNLISVYDFGEVAGMLYIIMEYVPGLSLFQAANGQPIVQQEVVPLIAAICRGLAHAHESGIIHRDIKPANILLNHNNEPKIGDFGLARPLENQLQEGEDIFGTPGYTAPEVLETPHSISHRADIFSLGVLLHELLTGLLPSADPRPASAICHCDPRFDSVIRKATHPSPQARYDSATEIAAEIEKISTTAGPRILQTNASGAGTSRATIPTRYPAPKKSGFKGFLIIILLIAVVGVASIYSKKKEEIEEANETLPTTEETQPIVDPKPTPPPPPPPPQPTPPPIPQIIEPEDTPPTPESDGLIEWNNAVFTWDESFGAIEFSVKSGAMNGKNDDGAFKYRIWEGDGLFTVEISPITDGPSDAIAGLMIRETLESDARNVLLARNTHGETIHRLRVLQGEETVEYNRFTAGHRLLRIHREGDRLTAVASRDGDSWTEIGSTRIPDLAQQIFVGFAAASAGSPSGAPLNGRFQPVQMQFIDTSLVIEGAPTPRLNMNELFRRARVAMKDQATPIQSAFQQQIKTINDSYILQSAELINQISGEDQHRAVESHSSFIKTIEAGEFIGARPPVELAEIPGYVAFHDASVERQRIVQRTYAAKMAELAESYLSGIRNQIERATAENDLGSAKVLEAEKERVITIPYYFRGLMEEND